MTFAKFYLWQNGREPLIQSLVFRRTNSKTGLEGIEVVAMRCLAARLGARKIEAIWFVKQ